METITTMRRDAARAMHMTWHDLLFAHWRVDAAKLRRWIPPGLEVDTYDGSAWIGVVPFHMSGIRLRGLPRIPTTHRFIELNVRTYVTERALTGGDAGTGRTSRRSELGLGERWAARDSQRALREVPGSGVWFFSLDATSRLAVAIARRWWWLNYQWGRMHVAEEPDGWINYASLRRDPGSPVIYPGRADDSSHNTNGDGHDNSGAVEFAARYRGIGDVFHAEVGSLEEWLTARYFLYAADARGRVYRGAIEHEPWPLQRAEANITCNTMAHPWSIDLHGEPHLLFAKMISTRGGLVRQIS